MAARMFPDCFSHHLLRRVLPLKCFQGISEDMVLEAKRWKALLLEKIIKAPETSTHLFTCVDHSASQYVSEEYMARPLASSGLRGVAHNGAQESRMNSQTEPESFPQQWVQSARDDSETGRPSGNPASKTAPPALSRLAQSLPEGLAASSTIAVQGSAASSAIAVQGSADGRRAAGATIMQGPAAEESTAATWTATAGSASNGSQRAFAWAAASMPAPWDMGIFHPTSPVSSVYSEEPGTLHFTEPPPAGSAEAATSPADSSQQSQSRWQLQGEGILMPDFDQLAQKRLLSDSWQEELHSIAHTMQAVVSSACGQNVACNIVLVAEGHLPGIRYLNSSCVYVLQVRFIMAMRLVCWCQVQQHCLSRKCEERML
jgi:hypothetical protein